MYKLNLIISLVIVLLGKYHQGFSQDKPILYNHHQKFETKDGLLQNYVSAIIQDQDGFMWFSTPNGLSRYDGREFLNFQVNEEMKTGLSFNNIHDMVLDDDNRLWIIYFNGMVDKMDLRTFKVTQNISPVLNADTLSAPFSYLNDFIRDWNVNDNGKYWFYSYQGKLQIFDSTKIQLAKAYHERGKINKVIYGYNEDSLGRLWLLTKDGYEQSDSKWKKFHTIKFPSDLKFDADSSLYRNIINLSAKSIMTAIRDQLVIYNFEDESFKYLKLPHVPSFHKKPIRCLTKDHLGRPILAYQGYVFRLEKNDDINILWRCPESRYATISSLFIDRTNVLWVATNGYGLYKINLLTPAFHSYQYEFNFLADLLKNHLAIPWEHIPEIWKIERAKQFWLRYFYDKDGQLIISNRADLQNNNKKVFFRLKNNELIPLPIPHERSIVGLAGNSSGELWALSSMAELYHWVDYEQMPSFETLKGIHNDSISLGSFDLEADNENLWVETKFNGLYQIKDTKLVKRFPPSTDSLCIGKFELTDIINDPVDFNILWIGTMGNGLIKWNKNLGQTVDRITSVKGLSNDNIMGVLHDTRGNIWLSTTIGLNMYNPKNGQITIYSTSDGLYEDEFQRYYHFVLPDGRFAFGGLNGYSVFDPHSFQYDTCIANLSITHFYVNNEPMDFYAENSILEQPINQVHHIDLEYNQNSIAFDLAAMQYNQPYRNRFRFMLKNYDNQWIESKDNNQITYNKLTPGPYTFLAMSCNTSGLWMTEPRTITITVHPPFWLTWWAYTFYGIIILIALSSYRNYYRRKIEKSKEFEFNQREAIRFKKLNVTISEQAERLQKINQTKDRLFTIISHDLRGPIASFQSISAIVHNYLQKNDITKVEQLMGHVNQSAKNINLLLDNLLNWSLSQEGNFQLDIQKCSLKQVVNDALDTYQEAAALKRINLTSIVDQEMIWADYGTLATVLRNLISNAIKFSPEQGEIILTSFVEGLFVKLKIQDQGIGMSTEVLDKLFDIDKSKVRRGTSNERGTGLGLVLVKEFITMNEATVTVESTLDQGTLFILTFKMAN